MGDGADLDPADLAGGFADADLRMERVQPGDRFRLGRASRGASSS
jgi:hypothetical protein